MGLSALSETRRRHLRYGALALAVVLLAAGAIFLSHQNERPAPATAAANQTTSAPSGRRPAAPPATVASDTAQATDPDDLTGVDTLRRDEAVQFIAEARRLATAGNFSAAEAALARADKAMPNFPETSQARLDIDKLETPDGQLSLQLQRARLAIDHDDSAAAEAALAEAARLQPDSMEVARLRADMKAAHDKKVRREARIAEALARMREAVARRDFGAANTALNEAERIDIQDPTIRRARGELARARGAPFND